MSSENEEIEVIGENGLEIDNEEINEIIQLEEAKGEVLQDN